MAPAAETGETDVGKERPPREGLQTHHHLTTQPRIVLGSFYELVMLFNFFSILSVSYIWLLIFTFN